MFATVVYYRGKAGVFAGSVASRGRRCGCNYEDDSREAGGHHFEI